jgi:hypothetical protein
MSTGNLINIMAMSAVFALIFAMIFRFRPVWCVISAVVGSVTGLVGAYAVGFFLATTNDAFIMVGMALAVMAQLMITKAKIGKSASTRAPRSASPREQSDSRAEVRSPTEEKPVPRTEQATQQQAREPKHIFLSYRRQDSEDIIGRIYDRLVREFGEEAVFKDVDSIPLGVDFRTHIATQLQSCEYFLAVIGKDWLDAADQYGKRRIDDPRDHVRLETQVALKKGIPVIPVLVRNANVPPETRLPEALKDLSFRNGLAVRPDPDFHRDMDRLIDQIKG